MIFENIVIGTPEVSPKVFFALDDQDWEKNEKVKTLFTNTRYLPAIMKEAGIVKSISEVKRNRPELAVILNKLDFRKVKWGKRFLYIIVGK